MGADFIMVKSQEGYCAKNVVDFLLSLKNIIHMDRKNIVRAQRIETPQQKQQRLTNRIISELNCIGISPNAVGRKYIIEGILLVMDDRNKNIHATIAEKYEKTASSVERAIQNAIEKAWKSSAIEDLETHYTAKISSSKGVPTIMEFLYYYAEKIKNTY
jgi:hypothetical protein